MVKLVFGSLK